LHCSEELDEVIILLIFKPEVDIFAECFDYEDKEINDNRGKKRKI
jgi:hypothetical protein